MLLRKFKMHVKPSISINLVTNLKKKKEKKSEVKQQKGSITTRDWLEKHVNVNGMCNNIEGTSLEYISSFNTQVPLLNCFRSARRLVVFASVVLKTILVDKPKLSRKVRDIQDVLFRVLVPGELFKQLKQEGQ